MTNKEKEKAVQFMAWLLAGGVGCAVVVGVGKVIKDMLSYAQDLDRPKARWEKEPPL